MEKAQNTIRLRTSPWWLPEKYRVRTSRIRVRFTPSPGERQIFRAKKRIAPSKWAQLYRTVTYGPMKGSRWDNNFMPHMRGIMDASFFPSVRTIGNIKCPQSASSAGAETMIGYVSDMMPGPVLIGYPDRDTASKRCTDYLQPMFKTSPRLKKLMTGVGDDFASLRIRLKSMLIYMAWSGSVTSLGNVSAKYLIEDECDKWDWQPSKKEASSHKLFEERGRSFRYGAKHWKISTPTIETGPIWTYLIEEADVLFCYHVDCPDCRQRQPMGFDQIRFPEDVRDPIKIEKEDLARYICLHCGSALDDRKRTKALRDGVWLAYGKGAEWVKESEGAKKPVIGDGRELFTYLKEERPKKIAFHSPAWISPLVENSEMAAAFLRGLKKPAEMHYFDTQIKAVAYKPERKARKEDQIYILADDRPDQLVPGGGLVAALTAGVDTQDVGYYYEIRAWGWGLAQSSWQIRYGYVRSEEALVEVLFGTEYKDAAGLYYPVHLAVIDAMGHRTRDVYNFVRRFPGRTQAYKGGQGRRANPITWSVIDRYPGTTEPIPGGVRLATCNSHHFKDLLAGFLQVGPDDPGSYRFLASVNEENPAGSEFARQMCAEYLDESNLWTCPEGKANHYLDTAVLNIIAAEILEIRYWPKGE